MDLPQLIVTYLIGINLLTVIMFWFDKWMARSHGWRIPELVLWLCALVGGSIGALVAIEVVRHKSKKFSFQFVLWLIILLQIALGVGYYWIELAE